MNNENLVFRNAPIEHLMQRLQISVIKPGTLDAASRSVEVIGATENPSIVWDPERWEAVNESLQMSGCEIPASRQIPLTIDHDRSASSVIGSFCDMRIEGDQLVGRAVFSSSPDADPFFTKVKEGHLNRFSIVYPSDSRRSVFVEENTTAVVNGKSYTGPILVTQSWQPRSLGLVLYAADDQAKARSRPNTTTIHKETENMDKRLRAYLERGGLSPESTEEQAWAYFEKLGERGDQVTTITAGIPAAATAATPPATDTARAGADVIRIERDRITEINAMCQRFGATDLAEKLIQDGASLDVARQKVMNKLELNPPQTPGFSPATVILDGVDKFRSAAADGLVIRSGIMVATPAAGAMDIAGWTLVEIARHSLRLANLPYGGNKMEMVGRALTSNDFPLLLANVANKSLFTGWEGAQETWREWCDVGSVSDFKVNSLPRGSETSDLDEMPPGKPYKYAEKTEAQETYQIATFGKMLAITRHAIINDDLGALTDIPKSQGEAAARKIGDLPYSVLTANSNMGDGNALFSAAHANYVAHGSGAIPGVATIAHGILAMGTQKDLLGKRRLNIRPVYFLGPKALEGSSEVFFRTDKFSDSNTVATDSSLASTRVNPYSGTVFTRVYESRLDDDDAAAWYLAASKGRTVKVFFLNGVQTPFMETQQGWNVDGVEYKVRIDAGAKAIDWKGLHYNDGN
ncbi:MAG: hypothetical protein V1844_09880 [Pseudomonadota bacterium]